MSNVKVGDIARYVGVDRSLHGYVVIVEADAPWWIYRTFGPGPWWITNPPMPMPDGRLAHAVADSALRPIRGEKGDDETLAWAGKPEDVTA